MAVSAADIRDRFRRFAAAGIFFQGGAAAVEPATLLAGLVHGLTGSPAAVGAAVAITRYGWLFPQIFVAYIAQGRPRRMPLYMLGSFGRAGCLAALAILMMFAAGLPGWAVVAGFFVLWTAYGFVSGIVAVPYNDIIGRSIPSSHRSRLFAVRFFGGGLLALGTAALAHEILNSFNFHAGYAALLALAAVALALSGVCFVSAGEPPQADTGSGQGPAPRAGFKVFLAEGVAVVKGDRHFRLFLYVQLLAAVVSMSLPFYIFQLVPGQSVAPFVAVLLAAQTAGALCSNPLWGWWGDGHGKLSLLRFVSRLNAIAPVAVLVWLAVGDPAAGQGLYWFVPMFFVLGAVGNGRTIAYLGYLMEISPDDRRPAYSGYFNALTAPAALSPLIGAAIADVLSFAVVFAISLAAAGGQVILLRRLARDESVS